MALTSIIGLGSLGLGACAFPGESLEDGEGIVGTYVVNGVDPLGAEYSGTVIIAEGDEPGVYTVQWLITDTIQEGVGRLSGDELTVEWSTLAAAGRGDASGTATLTVGDDGVLRGTRTVEGVDEVGTEEIFPEP